MSRLMLAAVAGMLVVSSVSYAPVGAVARPAREVRIAPQGGSPASQAARAERHTGRVIVGLDALEPEIVESIEDLGGAVEQSSEEVAIAVLEPPAGVEADEFAQQVEALTGVDYAEPEGYAYAAEVPNDGNYNDQWGLTRIGLPVARDLSVGVPGVVVAVIDTGLNMAHLDGPVHVDTLSDRDFVDLDDHASDASGHGTHVAGIVAAATNNTVGIAGVAPNVTILPVRVLDATGTGEIADVALGIVWAADHGADVINMSLTAPSDYQSVREACDYAKSKGCVLVGASGNAAAQAGYVPGTVGYPAAYPSVIAVGASTSSDTRASFSQYGPALDIVAPGQHILSLALASDVLQYRDGTSMAAPHVAGVAALVRSVAPTWTADMVATTLTQTAEDLGASGRDDQFGHGVVRADLALALASPATDDDVPGIAAGRGPVEGSVDAATDPHDVYWVPGHGGERIDVSLAATNTAVQVRLLGPGASLADKVLAETNPSTRTFSYTVPTGQDGSYILDVVAASGSGDYSVSFDIRRRSSLSIKGPTVVAYKGSALVSGLLWNLGVGPIAGAPVKIQAREYGSSTWKTVTTVTTGPTGGWYRYMWPSKRTSYRAVYAGASGEFFSAGSPVLTVTPKAYLTTPSAPKYVKKGRSFTSAGYLRPRHGAGVKTVRIKAYRRVNGVYKYYKTYYAVNKNYATATTKYSAKIKLPYRGKWRLVASVPSDSLNAATTSSRRYVTVY